MPVNQELKKIILEIKFKYNKRQSDIADDLGIKKTYLSDMINGRVPLTDNIANRIYELYSDVSRGPYSEINSSKKIKNEIIPVPEEDYMLVEFEDLEATAGTLGGNDLSVLPEKKTRLVPKEYGRGHFLVVRVHGHSMDDNTKRSISQGEELLIKQCFESDFNLPIRNKLFVIVTNEGSVVKQIKEIDRENKRIICHSFNPNWEDYPVYFHEILQIFTVEKKVRSSINF